MKKVLKMSSMISLLKEYDLTPKKSWGQNFLNDKNALDRIVGACDLLPGEHIVEIGAGLGALTDRLKGDGRQLTAIERDRDLVPVLKERFSEDDIQIAEANALTYDYLKHAEKAGRKIKIVGNLPYHISAPLLFIFLENRHVLRSAHILLQKEVAKRLAANPKTKDYGLLTVLFNRVAEVSLDTEVGKNCFVPIPKVDSSFISIVFKDDSEIDESVDDADFISFVKAAFHKRRKTLANSLSNQSFFPLEKTLINQLKKEFPDLLQARAETLDFSQFVMLFKRIAE